MNGNFGTWKYFKEEGVGKMNGNFGTWKYFKEEGVGKMNGNFGTWKYFKVRYLAILALFVLTVFIFPTTVSAQEFAKKFNVSASSAVVNAQLFVALKKGYFADEGLEPEIEKAQIPPPMAIQLMTGGKIDIALFNPSAGSNNAIVKGAPIIAIAGGAIVPAGRPNTALLVSDKLWKEGVKSLADLKGKTINFFPALDSTSGLAVTLLLQKGGLRPTEVELKGWRDLGPLMQAFEGGVVDIAYAFEPMKTVIMKKGNVHSLGSSTDVLPGSVAILLWANSNWLKKNEETTIRFLKAYLRGISYYTKAYESGFAVNSDVLDILAEYTKTNPALMREIGLSAYPEDGRINKPSLQKFMDFIKDLGTTEKIAPIDSYINERYVLEAYQRLKREGKI